MAWRLARSAATLRAEVDAAAPGRSKVSDGTIGDPRHQGTRSDHNPNDWGVVCALDITHDPAGGLDAHALADQLRRHPRHPQLKYIISDWRIASRTDGWVWRPYTGSNGHASHIHVSVGEGPSGASRHGTYDSTASWRVAELLDLEFSAPPPTRPRRTATVELPILSQATHGRTFDGTVVSLQALLVEKWAQDIAIDGRFGDRTEAAVKNGQRWFGLKVDGWVGAQTWPFLFL